MTDRALATAIDEIFARWRAPLSPGCAVAVLRAGEVIYEAGHGLASVEHRVPIGSETAFRVASITKQFVCGVALLLADDGKINLDANIREYLPEWSAAAPTVTVRQCMQNTSGIRDFLELLRLTGGGLATPHRLEESFALVTQQRATNFPPGSDYLYSNANFLLLSIIVERVSGQSLATLIDERICRPLGMTRTALVGGHDGVVDNMAPGYLIRADGGMRIGQLRAALSGEGGMISTLTDMITWARNYRDDKLNLIARLAVPARLSTGATSRYAHGLFSASYRGLRFVGHAGLWPGYRSEIVYFPDVDVGLICLANNTNIDPVVANRAVADMVVGDRFPSGQVTLDPDVRKRMLENAPYVDRRNGHLVEVTEAEGKLQISAFGGQVVLRPETERRLATVSIVSEFLTIELTDDGQAGLKATWVSGEQANLVPAASVDPARVNNGEFTGTFWSDELSAGIDIVVNDGALVARYVGGLPWGTEATLNPTTSDVFAMNTFAGPWPVRDYLSFVRDSAGSVTGLVLTTGRVRELSYRRRAR